MEGISWMCPSDHTPRPRPVLSDKVTQEILKPWNLIGTGGRATHRQSLIAL